jgi:hypothetical protein
MRICGGPSAGADQLPFRAANFKFVGETGRGVAAEPRTQSESRVTAICDIHDGLPGLAWAPHSAPLCKLTLPQRVLCSGTRRQSLLQSEVSVSYETAAASRAAEGIASLVPVDDEGRICQRRLGTALLSFC